MATRRYCVVLTHFVGNTMAPHCAAFTPARTRVADFIEDLDQIAQYFDFAPLSTVLRNDSQDTSSRRRPVVALTFDDGLNVFCDELLDGLAARRVTPALFITTDCIDNASLIWRHALSAVCALRPADAVLDAYNNVLRSQLSYLACVTSTHQMMRATMATQYDDRRTLVDVLWKQCAMPPVKTYLAERSPYLSVSQLRGLIDHGFEIGLHSASHPRFDQIPHSAVPVEIDDAARRLSAMTGQSRFWFAYPFGIPGTSSVVELLKRSPWIAGTLGVRGFTRRSACQTPFHVERISVEGDILHSIAFPARELLQYRAPAGPAA